MRFTNNFSECWPSLAAQESSVWGRLRTSFPGSRSRRGRLPAPGSAHTTSTSPISRGTQAKEGVRPYHPNGQREAWAPRGAVREIAAGPARPEAPKAIAGFLRCARLRAGRSRGGKGRKAGSEPAPPPGKPTARGSRLEHPPETPPSRARERSLRRSAPGGGRGSPPPSSEAPETPEESCASRGPERRSPRALPAPRAPLRSPLTAAASSSRAAPPQPRTRLQSLFPSRSLQGARRPRSQSLRAPAAPSVPVGAAPRDAPLQPRAALLRGGPARAGGVWASWEEGGTRRAPRLSRREEETATSPGLAEARMGRVRGTPSLCPTPTSGPPGFSLPSSPGTRRSRVALGLPLHWGPDSTRPCPARPLGF